MCSYSGQQCCVKDVSSIFLFLETEGSHPSEGAGSGENSYTHTIAGTDQLPFTTRYKEGSFNTATGEARTLKKVCSRLFKKLIFCWTETFAE